MQGRQTKTVRRAVLFSGHVQGVGFRYPRRNRAPVRGAGLRAKPAGWARRARGGGGGEGSRTFHRRCEAEDGAVHPPSGCPRLTGDGGVFRLFYSTLTPDPMSGVLGATSLAEHSISPENPARDMYRTFVILRHTFLEAIVQPIYALLLALGGGDPLIFAPAAVLHARRRHGDVQSRSGWT